MNLQRVLENNPAYSLAEARAIARVGRTTLYKAIGTGELRAIKVGSRTLILERDLYRWLEGMPPIVPSEASPELPSVEPSAASSEISQGSDRHKNAWRALRWIKANGKDEVSREEIRREALKTGMKRRVLAPESRHDESWCWRT
jgi:excisionase family DNA binding protein